MITFQDIAVCYKARERYPVNAIEKIDLHIGPGEWVFLVGPSGAGKSTLLKLVYHGHGAEALHGRITVDGQDVTHLKSHDIALLRRKVGVVFQDFQLLTQKTVWENVAFALQVIGTPQSRQVKEVPRALETVGLTHKAHAYPSELSGGEQQRVAIARAIVNHPTVLLADEPTGNLDPQTAADIAEVLRRINEEGTTILMATHDRHLVDTMRKRVVRIAGGRIVSDEANGVYHPEDEDLSTLRRAPVAADDEVHPLDDLSDTIEFEVPADSRLMSSAPDTRESRDERAAVQKAVREPVAAPRPVAAREVADEEPVPYLAPHQAPLHGNALDHGNGPVEDAGPAIPPVRETTAPAESPARERETVPVATEPVAAEPAVHAAPFQERPPYQPPASSSPTATPSSSDRPSPRQEPLLPDYVANTLENRAPLGSPDNPIVQIDRR